MSSLQRLAMRGSVLGDNDPALAHRLALSCTRLHLDRDPEVAAVALDTLVQ